MGALHEAVIRSLHETFTLDALDAPRRKLAADDKARAARQAERETLLARIPVLAGEIDNLTNAIAATGLNEALQEAIKARVAEREAAEARIADLEATERDLRGDEEAMDGLRAALPDWHAALDRDPVLARQALRKALDGPICVQPAGAVDAKILAAFGMVDPKLAPAEEWAGDRAWFFWGKGRLDGVLLGRLSRRALEVVTTKPHPGEDRVTWTKSRARVPISGGSDTGCTEVSVPDLAPRLPPARGPGFGIASRPDTDWPSAPTLGRLQRGPRPDQGSRLAARDMARGDGAEPEEDRRSVAAP